MPDAPTTPSHDAPAPARSGGGAVAAKVVAAGAVAGTAALAWALFEAQWFVLRHLHLTGVVHGSPRPLRILHLSDLHVSQRGGRMGDFITSLVDEDYDLVVVTGDLLGDASMEDDTVAMLAPLTASGTPGVVVLGSNDFHGPVARNPLGYLATSTASTAGDEDDHGPRLDTDRLVAGLAREGFRTLRNEVVTITTAKGDVVVSGLDDPHMGAPLPDARDVASTTQGIAHLGLVHSPYKAALDLLVGVGADLVLAGHTHGGQVRVPGVGALVTNSDLPPAQARGLSRHRNVPLHVSAGLGTSKYAPIRFACRPEATLLTLLP